MTAWDRSASEGPEFFLEGLAVGYFKEAFVPSTPGRYHYEPFRGPGHFELTRRLSAGEQVTCSYVLGREQVTFSVKAIPDNGSVDLERFERHPALVETRSGPWADLQNVMRGTLAPAVDARAAKMLRIMMLDPCDILLRPGDFDLWYAAKGRRHRYMAALMAPVVFDIMTSMSIRELHRPMVGVPGGLSSGSVNSNSRGFALWLVPGDEQVSLFVRESPGRTMPGSATTVPAEGPWMLPLPVSKRAAKDVSAACPCPHCGHSPPYFRMLSDDITLVCGACGRSFVSA